MKHLFIINPAAGSRDRTKAYTETIEALCKGLDYRIEVSKAPGHCRDLAREAAESGEEYRIYACGGDGTLNEVASGAAGYSNVAITVFSGGSGNDFIKLFDDPSAFFNIHRLLDADEVTFDMIRCNDHLGLNICSVGLDARINKDVSKYKRLPALAGAHAYMFSTMVNVFKRISEHYVIDVEGHRIDGRESFIVVCNGRHYGGSFHPVPDADPTDGKLDVLIVRHLSRLEIATIIKKYKEGRYKELGRYARYFKTDRVKVTCDRPTPVNIDGETRMETVAEFTVADEKVRFFYPKGLRWKK